MGVRPSFQAKSAEGRCHNMSDAAETATASVAGERARTKDSVMAASLISAHGFEHMYGRGFLVVIPKIVDELALVNYQAGLMDAARSVSSGLTSMGSGFFADMFQHRRAQILALSMAMIGIGYFLVAVSPTYVLILMALLLPSAGSALWHPPAIGLLSQRFPKRRGLLISLHRSTGNLGDTIGSLLVGSLLIVLGWRWIMGGGTPMLILLALVILLLLRSLGGSKPRDVAFGKNLKAQLHSLRDAFKGRGMGAILPIFVVSAVHGMGDRAFIWMIPLYLSKELGKSDFTVGVHVALLAAPGIIAGPLFGHLSDRIGRKSIIAFIMALASVLPVTMVLGGGGIGTTLSVAAFGLFAFSVNSLTQAAAIDVVEGKQLEGTFIGLMWGSNAFFGAATAVGAGLLADVAGRQAAFYLASSLFFLGFLASLVMPAIKPYRVQPA